MTKISLLLLLPVLLLLLDVVAIQLLNTLSKKLSPESLTFVLAPPELLVEPPDGPLAEVLFEIFQKVRCMLVAFVPVYIIIVAISEQLLVLSL
jgi:hypothetical protein